MDAVVKENSKAVGVNINTEIAIADERAIREIIYEVRGVKVMLDFELADIYGYTTKAFNQQVKNNIEKFDEDFRFQLTGEELQNLRSENLTSSWGGNRYRPWTFTEFSDSSVKGALDDLLATMLMNPVLIPA